MIDQLPGKIGAPRADIYNYPVAGAEAGQLSANVVKNGLFESLPIMVGKTNPIQVSKLRPKNCNRLFIPDTFPRRFKCY